MARYRAANKGGQLSGGQCGQSFTVMNLNQDRGGIIEALAALRGLAEHGINRFRIAFSRGGGGAEIALAYGIADAQVHQAFSQVRIRI
jgi:hypothetical protein